MTFAMKALLFFFYGLAQVVRAADFLASQPVSQGDVKDAFLAQIENIGNAQLGVVEEELKSMFTALPKTEAGTLDTSTVRYALHRYFVKKHGWNVRGLQGKVDDWDAFTQSTTLMKSRAPAFILSLLRERLRGSGVGLRELAVIAATMSNLIHEESADQLHRVFKSIKLPTSGPLQPQQVQDARDAWLLTHILGGYVFTNHTQYTQLWTKIISSNLYKGFNDTVMWFEDVLHTVTQARAQQRNPFIIHPETYDETLVFAQEVGHRFGSFQNLECHKLKRMLVDMEHGGSGRVPLAKFYSHTMNGGWFFSESVAYLRNFGALDDTDPSQPSVIIPNYINGAGNCLISTGFYQVCCVNECESLLAQVELAVASPYASPESIAKAVAAMPSNTVDAPRNLSSSILSRLREIAAVHRGSVPLHGRLFEQWMHHAYPRECPFPHIGANLNTMTMAEWTRSQGTTDASEGEMKRWVDLVPSNATVGDELPWDSVEQLVTTYRETPTSSSSLRRLLPVLAGLAAVASFASHLIHAGTIVSQKSSLLPSPKTDMHFV